MPSPRLLFTFALFAMILFANHLVNAQSLTNSRPNIVLIVADDLGWSALGSYGSDFYETPNIDALAKRGMRFTAAFSNMTNCAPSRASLMSGQYSTRHHVFSVSNYQDKWLERNGNLKPFKLLQPTNAKILPHTTLTLGESLKAGGYNTGFYGKWHLGVGAHHPSKRGFDSAIESHGPHFNFKTDPPFEHDKDQYLSDFIGHHAVDFIEQNSAKDAPFFLYFADYLIHAPLEAKEAYLEHFKQKQPGKNQRSPVAGAMLKSLDDTVGRIVNAINLLGIADDTLIIFTSDNGGLSYAEDGLREANTSNLPLRGRKGSDFDGGYRVPFIATWPSKIPAHTENHENIILTDLYPTFLALADAPTPNQPLDGVDISSLFTDAKNTLPPRDIYWYIPLYSAFNRASVIVRRGPWKMIHLIETGQSELYNTDSDIGESTDVASQNKQLTESMNGSGLSWLDQTDAPRMLPNPNYDPTVKK